MGTSKKKKSDYVPVPEAAPEVINRLHAVILVQTGQMSVSEAARQLGMSRNHFQSLRNKSLGSMLEALTPKRAGRPTRNQQVVKLQQEVEDLGRENKHLQSQVGAMEKIIDSLTEMVRENTRSTKRTAKRAKTPKTKKKSDPEDD
jgi:predicted DNA-binding protein (UPF0251 family)